MTTRRVETGDLAPTDTRAGTPLSAVSVAAELFGPLPEQLAQAETPRPAPLLPNDRFDLQNTWDYRQAFARRIRWMRENDPQSLAGISENIVQPAMIQRTAESLNRLLAGGQTAEQRQQSLDRLNDGIHEMFIACLQNARGDRTDAMVNVELLRRSFNRQLADSGSPYSLGPVQIAADRDGRLYMGLPILNDGRPTTGMIRLSPLRSQRDMENLPRIV